VELGISPSLLSETDRFTSDQIALAKPHPMGTVTAVSAGKSKPLPLSPAVSIFSVYKKTAKNGSLAANWSRSNSPWEETKLPKESLSSLEAMCEPAENCGLAAPKNVRMVASRERLIGKGTLK
jgi:hypothetical protein